MYTCICGKQITSQPNYSRHRKNCRQVNPDSSSNIFTCNICQKTFNRKDSYKRHSVKCSPKAKSTCKVCKKVFSSNWKLQRHLLSPNVHKIKATTKSPLGKKLRKSAKGGYQYSKKFAGIW